MCTIEFKRQISCLTSFKKEIGLTQRGDKSPHYEPKNLENTDFSKVTLFVVAQFIAHYVSPKETQMRHNKILNVFLRFAWCLGLSIFIGCGNTEDTDSIVIPSEFYDTSELTYDISDVEVQELMALEVPINWDQTKDRGLRAKYYHAHLLQQFGNIPAVHIIAAHERKRAKASGDYVSYTSHEMINFAKAKHLLWPNKPNRDFLEELLESKLRRETDDPELFAKIYREELIKQHGDIPEVDTVVEGETKLWFGGFKFPGDEDEYIDFLEAEYVLWPKDENLKTLEKYRKARAEGTPFHLVDADDNNE